MTYWLVLVVVGLGAGSLIDSPRVPTPVSTQIMHVGTFASQEDCASAATDALKANGSGSPGVIYRLLCVRAGEAKMAPPN
jgi:hypothetical protein